MESSHSPRSLKRMSDDMDEARIVKRLNMMQIDPYSQLYVPITSDGTRQHVRTTAGPKISSPEQVRHLLARIEPAVSSGQSQPGSPTLASASFSSPTHPHTATTAFNILTSPPQQPSYTHHQPRARNDDFMQVDSTADRVFIASIDDELADEQSVPGANSSTQFPIFVGDIERHLMGMPRPVRLFAGDSLKVGEKNQMVLYRPPIAQRLTDPDFWSESSTTAHEDGNYDGDDEVDVVEMPDDWVGRPSLFDYSDSSSDTGRENDQPSLTEGPDVVELDDDADLMVDD